MNFWKKIFSSNGQSSEKITDRVTIKDRIASLNNVPKFLKLVYKTSPSLTIANAILRTVMAMLPIVMLYVSKLIIDQVVLLSKTGNENISLTPLWQLVALEFGLVILSSALNMAVKLIDTLLGDLFANHTLIKIMSHAATLDLDQFEDSLFYDKLERARQQSSGRVALLTHVLTQVQDLITMCFFGGINNKLMVFFFLNITNGNIFGCSHLVTKKILEDDSNI